MIRIVSGKPGSGKTAHILKFAAGEISARKRPLLLTPTRFLKDRFSSRIAGETGGYAGTLVATDVELVQAIVERSGGAASLRRISDFESFLLVREILEDGRDKLEHFGRAVDYEGVVNLIYALVVELRASAVLHGAEEYDGCLDLSQPKHRDVAFIYGEYVRRLTALKLCDAYLLYRNASEALDAGLDPGYDSLSIDGYLEFSHSQYAFVRSLIRSFERRGLPVTVALSSIDHPVLNETRANFERDFECETLSLETDAAGRFGNLDRIAVTEIEAFGKYREAELAAGEMKRLVREEGYSYSDVAVITRDPDAYAPFLRSVFADFDIPYYFSRDEKLRTNPVIILLYSFISGMAFGIDNVSLAAAARSSYVTDPLLRELAGAGEFFPEYIKGGGKVWKDEIAKKKEYYEYLLSRRGTQAGDDEIDLLETQAVYNRLCKLEPAMNRFLDLVFGLSDGKPHSMDEWTNWLAGLVAGLGIQKALGDFELSSRYPVVTKDFMAFRKLKEVLKALKKAMAVFGKEAVDAGEFYRTMTDLISEVRYRYRFYPADSVKVLTPSDSRETSFRAVFVVGLNEGEFPKGAPLSMLDRRERRRVNELARRVILDDEARVQSLQNLDFLVAATRPRERLYLCRTPFDESGDSLLPSGYVQAVVREKGADRIAYIPPKPAGAPYSDLIFRIVPSQEWINVERFRTLVSNDFDSLFDKRDAASLRKWIERYPALDNARRMKDFHKHYRLANEFFTKRTQAAAEDSLIYLGRIDLDPASADDTAARQYVTDKLAAMTYSASRLETAGNCRHQFFIKYVLGIREETYPSQEIELRMKGTIFHRALELYVSRTRDFERAELPDHALLREALDEAFREAFHKETQSALLEYELNYYRTLLRIFSGFEAEMREGYRPANLEYSIDGSLLDLGSAAIRLDGSVDRADVSPEGRIRIADYKSGSVKHIAEGSKIPLKVFQGALYAKVYAEKEAGGDDSRVDSIVYLSLSKFEKNRPVLCDVLAGKDFRSLWELKRREILLLKGLLEDGNFMPYTTVDEFGADPGILDEYAGANPEEPVVGLDSPVYERFESGTKCKLCNYRNVCLRIEKAVSKY